jgi:hypothetical protein
MPGVAEDRAAAVLVVEEDRNQTAGEVVGQDGSDRWWVSGYGPCSSS